MRLSILVAVVLVLSFLVQTASIASATPYDPNNSAACATLPGFISWDSATKTCTVGSGTILGTDTLTIDSSYTLVITGLYYFDTGAAVTVNGALEISSTGEVVDYAGLADYGIVTVDYSGGFSGELYDLGTETVYFGAGLSVYGYYEVDGSLYNYGSVAILSTGGFGIYGYVDNENAVIDYGTIWDYDVLDNYATVTIASSGTLDVYDSFINEFGAATSNYGAIYIESDGEIYDYYGASFINEATGYIENDYGEVYNNGYFANYGTYYDYWFFYNDVAGGFYNFVYGEVYLSGDSWNYGYFDNEYLLQTDGTFENFAGGDVLNDYGWSNYWEVTNQGTIDNTDGFSNYAGNLDNSAGSIDNTGVIWNYCGATITGTPPYTPGGTYTGNPVQYLPCAPVITAPSTANTETPTVSGDISLFSSGGGSAFEVYLYIGEGTTFLGDTSSASSSPGAWSITSGVDLLPGTYTLYAEDQDAQLWGSGWSAPFTIDIELDTSTSVSCTPTPLYVGTQTTCTVTVAESPLPPKPTSPLGTVDLTGSPAGIPATTSCSLVPTGVLGYSQCQATYTPSGPLGPDTVTGTYLGDSPYWLGSSGTYGVASIQLGTSTGFSCPSLVLNVPVTCTATVSDQPTAVIPPPGTVAFGWAGTGTFTGDPCTLSGPSPGTSESCSVGFTPTAGAGSSYTMGASYTPSDALHSGSSTSATLFVSKRSTGTSVSCTPNPDDVNVATTCTATVSDTSPGTPITPTDTVTFSSSGSGTFSATTCTLVAGSCAVTYTPAPGSEGSATIGASYSGDSDHLASSSTTSLTVDKRSSGTAVSCSPDPDEVTIASTCTATVSDTTGGTPITPGGTVTFSSSGSGTFSSTTCTLVAGSCSVTYTPHSGSEGTATIGASYGGDTDHTGSSSTFGLSVVKLSSGTTVSCAPDPVAVNVPTTCTATVTGTTTPTGTVGFGSSGAGTFSASSCTLSPVVTGEAQCSVTYTPSPGSEGVPTITGSYSGDIDHTPSSGVFDLTVVQRTSSTTVSCAPNPDAANAPTTCTATVKDTTTGGTPITPGGTVTFSVTGSGTFSGPGTTCTLTLVSLGVAECSTIFTPSPGSEGTETIGASYGGDTDHSTSASSTSLGVSLRSVSISLSCPKTATDGTPISCTVTVTDTSGGTAITPSGVVTIHVKGPKSATLSCTLTGIGASASCTVAYTPTVSGTYKATASYPGDPNHLAIKSATEKFKAT